MALAHRYVAIYPSAASDPVSDTPYGTAGSPSSYDATYTTMSSMEGAENGDLSTGDGTVLHVEIIPSDGSWSGAKDATGGVSFDGWTTDRGGDGSYIELRAYGSARSSDGLWDTGAYIKISTGDESCVDIDNDHAAVDIDIEFIGVQFEQTYVSSGSRCIYGGHASSQLGSLVLDSCYLFANNIADEYGIYCRGNGTPTITLINSVIETRGASTADHGVYFYTNCTAKIINCTIVGWASDQIERDSGTVTVINSAVFAGGDDFDGSMTIDYCASDDGDGTNAIAASGSDWDNEFTDYANGDFTPLDSGNVYQAGKNQNEDADVPSVDIAGNARPTGANRPTVGAFEYAAAGGVAMPMAILQMNQFNGGSI